MGKLERSQHIKNKSHDYHLILQHILPLAFRGMFSKDVREPLIELSNFFVCLD